MALAERWGDGTRMQRDRGAPAGSTACTMDTAATGASLDGPAIGEEGVHTGLTPPLAGPGVLSWPRLDTTPRPRALQEWRTASSMPRSVPGSLLEEGRERERRVRGAVGGRGGVMAGARRARMGGNLVGAGRRRGAARSGLLGG